MSNQYIGGFISKTPPTMKTNSANGIWTITQLSQKWNTIYIPGVPILGTVTKSTTSRTAIIPYTAPTSNGGSPIISYTANSSIGGFSNTVYQSGSGTIIITGLNRDQIYNFTAYAQNDVGNSITSTASNSIVFSFFNTPANMGGNYTYMVGVTRRQSDGLFVAVGYDNTSFAGRYSTSTNGTTWTQPALMNGSTTASYLESVTVNNSGLFVAVGYRFYSTSTNGSTWTTPAQFTFSITYPEIKSVTCRLSDGLFVGVGPASSNSPTTYYPVYSTSTNGSTWAAIASMNNSTGSQVYSVTCRQSDGLFVAVGTRVADDLPVFASSTNGTTWTTPALINGFTTKTVRMFGVTCRQSDGLFVAVGYTPFDGSYIYRTYYATSTNGTTWTTPAIMNNASSNSAMLAVAVDSATNLFVAVGSTQWNGGSAVYATSTNGTAWTTPALMNNDTNLVLMNGITSNNSGGFVSVGYNSSGAVYSTSTAY